MSMFGQGMFQHLKQLGEDLLIPENDGVAALLLPSESNNAG